MQTMPYIEYLTILQITPILSLLYVTDIALSPIRKLMFLF